MGRKCKTYYVESLDKHLTIKELESISGISASKIYDRIHKLGWDVEEALYKTRKKANTSTTTNIDDDIDYIDSFINKQTKSFCNLDYIVFDKNITPVVIKFIDVKENGVTPFESHPYRYPTAWYMFTLLTKVAKDLGGYLYIINYNSADDSEYRILKVVDYNKNKISQHLTKKLTYCEYLTIEEDLCLNKKEFNNWVKNLDSINRTIRNKQYRILESNSTTSYGRPSYYKEAIPSKDHLGNKFYSFNAMCKKYNMKETTVRERLKRGWSMERALTEKPKQRTKKA